MILRLRPRSATTAFPDEQESLALQASLLDGDRAIEAWKKLSITKREEESGIAWIAPLLMANVARLCPDDPWVRENPHFLTLCELKGRAVSESAQRVVGLLSAAGLRTLALKGLALGATVYPSPGRRTVSDLDVLVPRGRVFDAIAALKASGYRAGPKEPKSADDLRAHHAHAFYPSHGRDQTLDLHWHVLASARHDSDDEAFWAEARPLNLGAHESNTLCIEDQLLHVLVHGVRWTRMPHVRWVADAAMILRNNQPFRIERFLEMIERYDVVTPVHEGLRFIHGLIGEGEGLLDRVRPLKRSRLSVRAFKARATAYESRTIADRVTLRLEAALWDRRARAARPR